MNGIVFYAVTGVAAAGLVALALQPVLDTTRPGLVTGQTAQAGPASPDAPDADGSARVVLGLDALARIDPGPSGFVTTGRGSLNDPEIAAVRFATLASPDLPSTQLPTVSLRVAPQTLGALGAADPLMVQMSGQLIPVSGPERLELALAGQTAPADADFRTIVLDDQTRAGAVILPSPRGGQVTAIVFRPIPRSGDYPNGVEVTRLEILPAPPAALRGR
jgi:hypothetical protein